MEKTRDYDLIMERARSHDFCDARLVHHYGVVISSIIHDTEAEPEGVAFSGDFREVVCIATGRTFELDGSSAFDGIDLPATYQRIASSPDYLSETLLIISECFRADILKDVARQAMPESHRGFGV